MNCLVHPSFYFTDGKTEAHRQFTLQVREGPSSSWALSLTSLEGLEGRSSLALHSPQAWTAASGSLRLDVAAWSSRWQRGFSVSWDSWR